MLDPLILERGDAAEFLLAAIALERAFEFLLAPLILERGDAADFLLAALVFGTSQSAPNWVAFI